MNDDTAMRERIVEQVASMLKRPGMYARDGAALQTMYWMRLDDLRFLDSRSDRDHLDLGLDAKYGKCGVVGPFQNMFGKEHRYYDEVASVYAEVFHSYGYFTLDRMVPDMEWAPLLEAVTHDFAAVDVRRSEIIADLGEPSVTIGRVLCYAPDSGSGWVFVDCFSERTSVYEPGKGYVAQGDDDPLVRSIRLPGKDFEESLRLTLYGKVLRWGPGWWLHHAPELLTDTQRAIAMQLRAVQAADPSQAGREPTGSGRPGADQSV